LLEPFLNADRACFRLYQAFNWLLYVAKPCFRLLANPSFTLSVSQSF